MIILTWLFFFFLQATFWLKLIGDCKTYNYSKNNTIFIASVKKKKDLRCFSYSCHGTVLNSLPHCVQISQLNVTQVPALHPLSSQYSSYPRHFHTHDIYVKWDEEREGLQPDDGSEQ